MVFGLTRPVLEPTTYRTRDKNWNHYTADGYLPKYTYIKWHILCGISNLKMALLVSSKHLYDKYNVSRYLKRNQFAVLDVEKQRP